MIMALPRGVFEELWHTHIACIARLRDIDLLLLPGRIEANDQKGEYRLRKSSPPRLTCHTSSTSASSPLVELWYTFLRISSPSAPTLFQHVHYRRRTAKRDIHPC